MGELALLVVGLEHDPKRYSCLGFSPATDTWMGAATVSEIGDMNKAIRVRGAYWGVGVAILTAEAVAPQATVSLFHGDFMHQLWWFALVGAFLLLVFILEGLDVGRHPSHRIDVNRGIVRAIVKGVCSKQDCPSADSPSESVREHAMAIFYSLIDQPSRETAFHHWGWLYFSILAFWESCFALVAALVLTLVFPTTELPIRILAIVAIAGSILVARAMTKKWKVATEKVASSQVIQIRPRLPARLTGATCPDPACPCTP